MSHEAQSPADHLAALEKGTAVVNNGPPPAQSNTPLPASTLQPTSDTQTLIPPVRTSSRGPSSSEAADTGGRAGSRFQQELASTADAQGAPTRKRSLLDVPQSSTQANDQTTSTGTGLSGATVSDPAESIGRGSKRSSTGRRAGSTTSSKRSQSVQNPISEKNTRSAATSSGVAQGAHTDNKPKKKGVSRFLSFLNCCGAHDEGHAVGPAGTKEAAQEPNKLRSTRAALPATAKPQDASAAQSSTADSKEPIDEKLAGTGLASEPGAPSENRNSEAPVQGNTAMDKPMPDLPSEAPGVIAPQIPLHEKRLEEPPLPPLPSEARRQIDTSNAVPQSLPQSPTPYVMIQAPTPVVPQDEEQVISDRTPEQEQRDTDIEMTDAGPSLPLASSDVPTADEDIASQPVSREAAPTKIDLPPPPPLAERQAQVVPSGTATQSQDTSLAVTPAETQKWLLPPIRPEFRGKKCLILHQADFTIPVEIEGQYHNVYVIKRPGVDAFMKRVGELYEVVVFTASVSKYGDPLLDQLDIHHVVHHRLFRESCYNHQGNYVKDLSQVGRDLRETIIIDNSPTSYIFHPQHAVPISSWFSDAHDNELLDLIPVLEDLAGPQPSSHLSNMTTNTTTPVLRTYDPYPNLYSNGNGFGGVVQKYDPYPNLYSNGNGFGCVLQARLYQGLQKGGCTWQ
ncbi:hypothetical protein B0A49_11375 [Cryomyces minteri]|uniref:FCP1 homology domain-containing protein n=1 Tax=Cryomyces minteri TaxID=331657 RepID=A0A4U0WDV7_9PEZI|nr:hypothetical protein B0A49_11375 [Cryomyces minteri]